MVASSDVSLSLRSREFTKAVVERRSGSTARSVERHDLVKGELVRRLEFHALLDEAVCQLYSGESTSHQELLALRLDAGETSGDERAGDEGELAVGPCELVL